jgi:hypothetical protein
MNFKRKSPEEVQLLHQQDGTTPLMSLPKQIPAAFVTVGTYCPQDKLKIPDVCAMLYQDYLELRRYYGIDTSLSTLVLQKAHDRSKVISGIVGKLVEADVPYNRIWAVVRMSDAYQSRVNEKGQARVDQDILRLLEKFNG